MQDLSEFRSPWPFPRIVFIRAGGSPVPVLVYEFKFKEDGTLKGVFGKIGSVGPTFLNISTFFKSEREAQESLTNTVVKDVFDEPALM